MLTYGFAFGTSVSLAAWSTGFTLEEEKREKPLNTRLKIKGNPEPHPTPHLSTPAPSCTCRAGDAGADTSGYGSSSLEQGSAHSRRQMEVSGDTHAVTLGAGGTAGTLGSRGTARTGEARSACNARSTLEEADGGEGAAQPLSPGPGQRRWTLTVAPLAPG